MRLIDKDTIYRQGAVEALKNAEPLVRDFGYYKVIETIRLLPSAEPEIIHCKNCKHRESNDCPMYYEEWIEIDEGDGYFDADSIIHDWTTDEGFCHCAELRGKEE